MINLKLYIANIALGAILIAFCSCEISEEVHMNSPELIDASKGTSVLSLFEEIDMIVLALVQYESINGKLLTLSTGDFCQETIVSKNAKENSVTADFGVGCLSTKGVKRAGIIKIINGDTFWANGNVTQVILSDFYIDGVKISGKRILTNKGVDQANRLLNFEAIMDRGMVTWPSEEPLYTDYQHDRAIYFPSANKGFSFSLVGQTEIKDLKGNSLRAEIVDPMVFNTDCMVYGMPSPSSGSLAIKRGKSETVMVNFNQKCN